MAASLDLRADPIALTAALVDIPSESRDEARIADEVEAALRAQAPGFEVIRNGDAVLARTNLGQPSRVMYDCEEIEAAANGLGRIERELPDWLAADVAILGEPSGGYIEAGCQGTLRVLISAAGTRAHSARCHDQVLGSDLHPG